MGGFVPYSRRQEAGSCCPGSDESAAILFARLRRHSLAMSCEVDRGHLMIILGSFSAPWRSFLLCSYAVCMPRRSLQWSGKRPQAVLPLGGAVSGVSAGPYFFFFFNTTADAFDDEERSSAMARLKELEEGSRKELKFQVILQATSIF